MSATKPFGVPRTDALFQELSRAKMAETPTERQGRVEYGLLQLCAELEKELIKEKGRVEHTQRWYAVRFERLKDLGKERGCWPEMAAIIANGSATRQLEDGTFHYDPPTYDQQMNSLRYRSSLGWKEAAIAWEVCRSIHEKYAKGKDALYTTRNADFVKHAADARSKV